MKMFNRQLKSQRGFTLVELIVVVALINVVLAAVFGFLFFGQRAWISTNAESNTLSDSRLTMTWMDQEIRQAYSPGSGDYGVTVSESGARVAINTYVQEVPKLISYRVTGGEMLRSVAEPDTDPDDMVWQSVIEVVAPLEDPDNPGSDLPYFAIDGNSVLVNLEASDERDQVNRPITVTNVFTVRSKGVMP